MDATETKGPKPSKRRRRGNGEGSIFQRADGRWAATIAVGYDAKGKRVRRWLYGWTKREVQEALTRLQSQKLDGVLSSPGKMTVSQFLTRWLQDVARVTVRATTYYNYDAIVKNHIGPRIGGINLQKLTPANVQRLYSEMERDGIGPHARRLAHAVLHRALKQAVKWGQVVRNACEAVEQPRIVRHEIQPLTGLQVGELLTAAVGDRLEALYWTATATGLRLGELFGLHWRDVDLAAGKLSVRYTLTEIGGKLELTEPKSKKSRRQVTIPAQTVLMLLDHRKRTLADGLGGSPYVFCNHHGGLLRRSHFHREDFKPLLKRAGLPDFRFHDLRHTSATLLLAQGVHPKVVQERLGHSQIGLTLDTYSHVVPSLQDDAAKQLDAVMIPATSVLGCKLAVNAG